MKAHAKSDSAIEDFDIPLKPKEFITKSCVVTGISASSLAQVEEALNFSAVHQIRPKVQVFALDEAPKIFKLLASSSASMPEVCELMSDVSSASKRSQAGLSWIFDKLLILLNPETSTEHARRMRIFFN